MARVRALRSDLPAVSVHRRSIHSLLDRQRLAKGDSRANLHRYFIQRGLTLVLLGILYNRLLSRDLASAEGWGEMRYASVLGRIGLAYSAALIAANTNGAPN